MKIKRFTVANMQAGLKQISEMLGPEAVILSNRRLAEGLEIVAGVDELEYERYQAAFPVAESESDIIKADPAHHESLDKDTMTELFNVMADKNKQAFESVKPADYQPEPVSRPAPTYTAQQKTAPIKPVLEPDALQSLRQEIDGLKNLLKEQTEQLKEPISLDISPQYERLEARLQALGFGHSSTRRLMQAFDREESLDINWRRMMARLVSSLSVPLYPPLSSGGIFALTGPTGAGKTTTTAKLAAHGVRDFGQETVAVISMDWFQVGGQEMLKSVCNILGITYIPMKEADSLETVLSMLTSKKLVLIDTSGSAEAMILWNQFMTRRQLASRVQTLLVIPATMHGTAVNQFVSRLKQTTFIGVVLSKLDEAGSFGSVLEPILKHHWALWYVTMGQQIPQDIETADAKPIVKKLVQCLKAEPVSYASVS